MSEVKGTKALELWCKRLVKDCPNVQIENMTTSWRNGMAFCALVHHFRPDLIDMSKLQPDNVYENNQLAYSIAEKHLGIPALLDAEDMVENDIPDRLSVLTYLSQFYQRLGHSVNSKLAESDTKSSPLSEPATQIKFGKVALDKCATCGLPVYLAQRLIVSQKLYHRQCFRCSKCSGHLNPKNYHVINSNDFLCDSCKNEKNIVSKYLNNNDQMGMLAFSDTCSTNLNMVKEELTFKRDKTRPNSILDKINMFENNIDKDSSIESKIGNISLSDNINEVKYKDIISGNNIDTITTGAVKDEDLSRHESLMIAVDGGEIENAILTLESDKPENNYKSSIEKFNFLQTQLSGDSNIHSDPNDAQNEISSNATNGEQKDTCSNIIALSNITDDSRLAQTDLKLDSSFLIESINENSQDLHTNKRIEGDVRISVPPRRKKSSVTNKKADNNLGSPLMKQDKAYPDHLNPFSEDEEEEVKTETRQRVSTNPFGSSDEEDEIVPHIESTAQNPNLHSSTPVRRHITAYNPFWSDGEEPSSDEEYDSLSSSMHKSTSASNPHLPSDTPRRRKPKAPPPPLISVAEHLDVPSTSMDDVASLSSVSSHTSTVHSDQKSMGKVTPKPKKKRPAPTPPDCQSVASGCGASLDAGDASLRSLASDGSRRKGPAPGLPLPERREVKMQMTPEELQVQLDLLETQQLGLERQGVLIEQMIRDKCEGDEGATAPQEEIEDLVIQLCELVNEKNDLFRKQTELMYTRRQQRLEQEQADIEHEIRIIQSRPAVNRIDADKAREEQFVCRLVEIVRMRDELVQQIDAERRRERQEDLAIATSIATKRAQRNSDSKSIDRSYSH
ncbi:unnamed protein product [Leptosia nina]|uniref:MICAL-like protein 1 n=1 Tax=Leptosia nina TaxID=320188 RepID=A0AAV1J7B3_9NEOP